MNEEFIKIKVDFYADTFRHCILEVPNTLESKSDTARNYICDAIGIALENKMIYPPSAKHWLRETGFVSSIGAWIGSNNRDSIKIITARYVR